MAKKTKVERITKRGKSKEDAKKNRRPFIFKTISILYNKYVVMLNVLIMIHLSWVAWAFHFYFYASHTMRPHPGERTLVLTPGVIHRVMQCFTLYRRENGAFVGVAYILEGIRASYILYALSLVILFIIYDFALRGKRKINLLISGICLIIVGILAAMQFNTSAGFPDLPFFPIVWSFFVCSYAMLVILSGDSQYARILESLKPLAKGQYLIDSLRGLPLALFIVGFCSISTFLTGAPAGTHVSFLVSSGIAVVACVACWFLVRYAQKFRPWLS